MKSKLVLVGRKIIHMLVSYKWLKELVDLDVTSAELAEKMSTTGIEVEGVSSPAEGLSKIVVGEVLRDRKSTRLNSSH